VQVHWVAVFAFIAVALAVTGGLWLAGKVLGVRAAVDAPLKGETYESGEEPVGNAWIQFNPRYYVVALVFVLFDVEAALLFPWALQTRGMGMGAAMAGLVFLSVLMLGWLYALRKGALKWR
jgi:NADH:ubiquinone oxidoreductase subunit 3 (subunit A)